MKPAIACLFLLGSLLALPLLADNDPATTPAPTATPPAASAPATTLAAPQDAGTPSASKPHGFTARTYHHHNGVMIAQVLYVGLYNETTVIVEIPNATSGLTRGQRAQIIAERLQANDKSTLQRLKPGIVKSRLVLLDPVKNRTIVTIAPAFAAFHSQKDSVYMAVLQATLRDAVTGYFLVRQSVPDFQLTTPEEKQERAILYRQKGDENLEQGRKFGYSGTAEHLYTKAIALDPKLAAAYLDLCSLYLDANIRDKAKDIYQQAVSAGLDLKAEAQAMKSPEAVAMLERLK